CLGLSDIWLGRMRARFVQARTEIEVIFACLESLASGSRRCFLRCRRWHHLPCRRVPSHLSLAPSVRLPARRAGLWLPRFRKPFRGYVARRSCRSPRHVDKPVSVACNGASDVTTHLFSREG